MITLEDIHKPVTAELEAFDDFVERQFTAEGELLSDMLRYALSTRGKGIRPMLVMLSAAMNAPVKGASMGRRACLAAMLVEMIHVASLIHDDVIDESDMRRGKPSANARWQSHKAVILGDYILAKNMNIGLQSGQFDLVTHVCGSMAALCEGEVLQDDCARNRTMTRQAYLDIIYKKTASLLGVSASAGALAVGATRDKVATMRRFGEAVGMAFQIQDDILDYTPSAHTGKPANNDLREGKKVFIEGMISNNGKEFDAHIQINAERRGIEYIFDNDKLFNRQSLGGVELTKQQVEDLNAGKAIFVEGMERKDGERFSSYVKLDEVTGRPAYTRYNPDSPEGAREIYIPNEINGVKITAEEQQQLREGRTIFLNDMVNRKGEEFSSFIKADLETGRLSYSRTPDGFEQRAEFKIPDKVWDVELTRKQRSDLQSGKAVLVEGIKGYDGKTISQYVKANFNQGRLDFYNENPDRKRDASQRNVVAETQRQEQGSRKSKGASIA